MLAEPRAECDTAEEGETPEQVSSWTAPRPGSDGLVHRMKDAMVAASEKSFEDMVPNKWGFDLAITAVIAFLFVFALFFYFPAVAASSIGMILETEEVRAQYNAAHIFCPFRCGGNGGTIGPGYEFWIGSLVTGVISGGFAVYTLLVSGFTDFRGELVLYKKEEEHKSMTIIGTFYEDVGSAHFGSVEMQTSAILKTGAKYTGKLKSKDSRATKVSVTVEFNNAAQGMVGIPYFQDSEGTMKNDFRQRLNAKLSHPIADKKLTDSGEKPTAGLPDRYASDPMGSICAMAQEGAVPLKTVRLPRVLEFWITYACYVLGTILFFYAMGRIISFIFLTISYLSGACDTEEAKREHTCDIAWMFSPVPLKFQRPGHYVDVSFFIVTTLATFVYWYFKFPTEYRFFEQGVAEIRAAVPLVGRWLPRRATVLLYRDAISARNGKDWLDAQEYQVMCSATYEVTVSGDAAPVVQANFHAQEGMVYHIAVKDPLREEVAKQISDSHPALSAARQAGEAA